jgi:iron complex outermembrane receptor protein
MIKQDSGTEALTDLSKALQHRAARWLMVLGLFVAWVTLLATGVEGEENDSPPAATGDDVMEELTRLMQREVISVARKQQSVNESAAAITVLTSEEIRRSGAVILPELFKNLPGVEATRHNAALWGISTRGFNDVYADKLLVMLDGRSIYTPLFGGVHWEIQDLLLEDIERIEIVRGPGATLFGPNAVNGVINIITRSSRDTRGVLATAGVGTELQSFAGFRFGDAISENLFFRYSGKYTSHDEFNLPQNSSGAGDGWTNYRHDLRMDWYPNAKNHLLFEASHYYGEVDEVYFMASDSPPYIRPDPFNSLFRGGSALARHKHYISPDADFSVQVYYDRTLRHTATNDYELDTIDFEFENRWAVADSHELMWGGGYRLYHDNIQSLSPNFSWDPVSENWGLWNAFAQDEISLMEDRLLVTLGSKIESDYFSGTQILPSLRTVWMPDSSNSIWASVSKATRTPARGKERDVSAVGAGVPPGAIHPSLPTLISVEGSQAINAESLMAFEVGYRAQASPQFSVDLSVFYNSYQDLIGRQQLTPFVGPFNGTPVFRIPSVADNTACGHFIGFESAVNLRLNKWWRTQLNYTFTAGNLREQADFDEVFITDYEVSTPRNRAGIRSWMDLPGNVEMDVSAYYRGRTGRGALNSTSIPSHIGLDLRLAWRPTEKFEIALIGREIQEPDYPDYASFIPLQQPSNVQRNIFLKLTLDL